jgi:hypothetical protein
MEAINICDGHVIVDNHCDIHIYQVSNGGMSVSSICLSRDDFRNLSRVWSEADAELTKQLNDKITGLRRPK